MTTSWLVFIIYSSLLWGHNIVVAGVSGQCLSHQQSLLLQLKNELIFSITSSKILVKWNESSNEDCCRWPGIRCDGEGHVTGLKLSHESIYGGFDDNSTLFNLVYLRSLDLSSNYLLSTIPSRIGNLSNLSYLNFSGPSFEGQIPKEISRLSKLITLDLSKRLDSYNTDESCPYCWSQHFLEITNLRTMVENLTELEELYLDGVDISAAWNEWGTTFSSSKLPNLRVLSLIGCNFHGPILKSLARLKSLSVVQLDYNQNLSSRVPEYFANFSDLTSLSLSGCSLYGALPKGIFQVQTLTSLDLSDNPLLQVSFSEFPMDSHLQHLVLRETNLGGRLPDSIGNLMQLSTLDVSYCHLSGPLPKSITNLTQLVYLDLSDNNFTGPIPSFCMFKNLTNICLSNNHFMGPIPSAPHWEGLLHLDYVDLHNNSFNGNIPSSLFSLPSIYTIDLSYNQFYGQILEFPNAPSSLLRDIDLSSNQLQGTIPMSFFKLKELVHLALSFNKFNSRVEFCNMTQNLPNLYLLDLSYNTNLSFVSANGNNSNFSCFPQLVVLYLSFCKIGAFPDPIKYMPSLYELDLSNNQIPGMIPSWVWSVGSNSLSYLNLSHNQLVGMHEPYSFGSNIWTLDLSFNQFRGKIPILPPMVDYIDLSFNQFQGKIPILPASAFFINLSSNNLTSSIPSKMGLDLTQTYYLSLSNNGLSGVIPKSICYAKSLNVLDLSKNNLNGSIPRCLLAMNQIDGMNLRGNNLRGSIPDAFPVNCTLKILDVNGNLLTNKIPRSLRNCNALELLNIGNNQLVDTFPLFLKKISSLRVLFLRSNKLHGHITCSDNIGDWPMIKIMSVASNNFSGVLPFQCLTKWHAMMAVGDDGQSQSGDPGNVIEGDIPVRITFADAVIVTNKGLEMELVKQIHEGFTCIDFSSNNFHGKIPTELGQLKSLMVLNLSNNALTGHIPSSFGNFHRLESLDLSRNHLNGEIPASLSDLDFLQFLDLSHNQLSGRIPEGSHFQTFSAEYFEDNEGLCGPPLTPHCNNDEVDVLPKTPHQSPNDSNSSSEIKWDLISVEVGFIVGFGTVIAPLVFSRGWRKRYFDQVEDIAFEVLPQPILRKWLSWKMGMQK